MDKKDEVIYDKVKGLAQYALNSPQYESWFNTALTDFDLYEGKHWTDEEEKILKDRKQPPLVFNKFGPKVDTITGVEEQARIKIAYRARSSNKSQEDMARGFTQLGFYIQDSEEVADKKSQVYKEAFVCGVGWLELYVEDEAVKVEASDCFAHFWDPDDTTQDMSKLSFAGKYHWSSIDEAIKSFPGKEEELRKVMGSHKSTNPIKAASTSKKSDYSLDKEFRYFDSNSSRLRIVEVQYRELATVYDVSNVDGSVIRVYNKEDANKVKAEQGKIEEKKDLISKFAFYTDGILLDHGVTEVQSDKYFNYIPFVYKREKTTGIPFGLARAARDPQIEYNKRRSKALHFLNSRQIVMDADAVEDVEGLRNQAARPDGIIVKKQNKELSFPDNANLTTGQFQMMQVANAEMQEVTGVFDELQGAQTNATSGVAQQRRQTASTNNFAHAFLKMKKFSKRFGEALIPMMQAAYTKETEIQVIEDKDAREKVVLNEERAEGVIMNDVRAASFSVHVEEVPDYSAAPEEERELLSNIVMNGQAQILTVPSIARMFGFRDPEKVSAEIAQALQPSQQQAGGSDPSAGGPNAGAPSPQTTN